MRRFLLTVAGFVLGEVRSFFIGGLLTVLGLLPEAAITSLIGAERTQWLRDHGQGLLTHELLRWIFVALGLTLLASSILNHRRSRAHCEESGQVGNPDRRLRPPDPRPPEMPLSINSLGLISSTKAGISLDPRNMWSALLVMELKITNRHPNQAMNLEIGLVANFHQTEHGPQTLRVFPSTGCEYEQINNAFELEFIKRAYPKLPLLFSPLHVSSSTTMVGNMIFVLMGFDPFGSLPLGANVNAYLTAHDLISGGRAQFNVLVI